MVPSSQNSEDVNLDLNIIISVMVVTLTVKDVKRTTEMDMHQAMDMVADVDVNVVVAAGDIIRAISTISSTIKIPNAFLMRDGKYDSYKVIMCTTNVILKEARTSVDSLLIPYPLLF